jgi:hypothetical protein
MTNPLPPFNVGTIVPSMRDFLQAVRTRRKGLAVIPCLAPDEAAREALRNAEEGVAAIALVEPGPAMAAAAEATRVPVLCLRRITTKDEYLAARAYGADAVIIGADLAEGLRTDLAKGSRSTRMAALQLARTEAEAQRAVDEGARGVVLAGPDAAAVSALAKKVPPSITLIAWPARAAEGDVRSLSGGVDAVIVGVDVYGVTGFERFVSELGS